MSVSVLVKTLRNKALGPGRRVPRQKKRNKPYLAIEQGSVFGYTPSTQDRAVVAELVDAQR